MYRVEISTTFETKTKEQAEYIGKFFEDAAALMTCANSYSKTSDVIEVKNVKN